MDRLTPGLVPRTVEGLMVSEPIEIEPEDPIELAESVLSLAHVRHWPVARAREMVGMISIDDLAEAHTVAGLRLRAGDLASVPAVVAHPGDDLCEAVERMRRHRLSCLPVVERGDLIGVLTRDDLLLLVAAVLEAEAEELGAPIEVGRLMTRSPVATVGPFQTLEMAEAKMRMLEVRHLPVARGEALLGILAERDLRRAKRDRESLATDLVWEVMTASPLTVAPESSAVAAARTLLERGIGALPVLSGGRLAGIVTRDDYLRHLAAECVGVRIDP